MKMIRPLFISMIITAIAACAGYGQDASKEAASSGPEAVKVTVDNTIIEKRTASYSKSLKEIVREAEANLKKVDQELQKQQAARTIRESAAKGDELYKEGKLEEAKEEYKKAVDLSKEPAVKKHIKESERKAPPAMKASPAKKAASAPAKRSGWKLFSAPAARQAEPAAQPASRYGTEVQTKSRVDRPTATARPAVAARAPVAPRPVPAQQMPDTAAMKAKEEAAARARTEADKKAKESAEMKARAEAEKNAKAEAAAPIAAAVSAPASEDVSNMYREAVSLYWDNKYAEAKAKFNQVEAVSPDYARTAYYLGRIKEKLGK